MYLLLSLTLKEGVTLPLTCSGWLLKILFFFLVENLHSTRISIQILLIVGLLESYSISMLSKHIYIICD